MLLLSRVVHYYLISKPVRVKDYSILICINYKCIRELQNFILIDFVIKAN